MYVYRIPGAQLKKTFFFFLQIGFNGVTVDIILTLDSKNYTVGDLAVEMLTQLKKIKMLLINSHLHMMFPGTRFL